MSLNRLSQFRGQVQFQFDQSAMETILGSDYSDLNVQKPLLMVCDSRVTQCADILADAFLGGLHEDTLYGQSLTTALLVALHSAASGNLFVVPTGGLASWQLRIAKEHLEQHVGSDSSLADIAELIGLSLSRLVRGFKASTGYAPYTWWTQARIQKAKALLAGGTMSLSEIALEVGFADQSHFTKAFKRSAGVTPGAWRHGGGR
jgi:AraC family transcriptional regulator